MFVCVCVNKCVDMKVGQTQLPTEEGSFVSGVQVSDLTQWKEKKNTHRCFNNPPSAH